MIAVSVSLSVGLSVTRLRCAKKSAEQIKIRFGMNILGARNTVLDGGTDPPTVRGRGT